jgi:hypothetical protein
MNAAGRERQRGTATVEFAVAGVAFFLVLLGVIEVGRTLFVWNALDEVTRRGARVAAVCPVNHSAIAHVAILDEPSGSGTSPFLHGLGVEHITVEYLDANGSAIADPEAGFAAIRYVRVSVTGYEHTALIPFLDGAGVLGAPGFAATLPRESLGIPRQGDSPICFGSAS